MNLFNSTDTYFGLFETHTLIMSFNCNSDDLAAVTKKIVRPDGAYLDEWEELSEKELSVLATDVHEHDHFNQFIASPFGILLWRCYQVLIRDTFTAIEMLKRFNILPDLSPGESFLEWWSKKGRGRYTSFRNQDQNYLELFVIREMELVDTFLDILVSSQAPTKYAKFTLGEFTELLNDLYPRLARRSGLTWRVQWKTHLPKDSLLFGNETCGFNVLPIIEGMSKIREHIVLLKNSDPQQNIDRWRKGLHAYYKQGYDYAIENFLPTGLQPESARHLGHAHSMYMMSLYGNIDIVCPTFFFEQLVVEYEFPWFRCSAMKDPARMLLIRSEMSNNLNRILCKTELFTAHSKWDTEEIRWLSATGEDIEVPEFTRIFMRMRAQHFRLVENHFFRAHKLIFNSLQSGQSAGNDLVGLTLIEEYNDRFIFVNTPKNPDVSFFISWIVPLHLAYQQKFMLNLFYGTSSKRPDAVGEKFLQSLQYQFNAIISKLPVDEQQAFKNFFSTSMIQPWIPVSMDSFLEQD